jgi:hypothetical protein
MKCTMPEPGCPIEISVSLVFVTSMVHKDVPHLQSTVQPTQKQVPIADATHVDASHTIL